jgi:hypothetical protein
MEQAIKYTEHMNEFVGVLMKTPGIKTGYTKNGRRFDRIVTNGAVKYFVDRHSWEIFGAKSSFQYNPRRQYGKLDTVAQFDWATGAPKAGTVVEQSWQAREAQIQSNYKPRGRPRKTPVKP